jgi:hypothetical protein
MQTMAAANAEDIQPKSKPTLSLKLEVVKAKIPSATAPVLRLTIENVGKADEKFLKLRGDLQDTYYDLVITNERKSISLPRAISDPGPIAESDFLILKPGKKATFEFSNYAVAVDRLSPGKYEAQIRFWQNPDKPSTTAVMSPAATFTVEK